MRTTALRPHVLGECCVLCIPHVHTRSRARTRARFACIHRCKGARHLRNRPAVVCVSVFVCLYILNATLPRNHLPRYLAVHSPLTGARLSPHRHRNLSSSRSFTQLVNCSRLQSLCMVHSRPFAGDGGGGGGMVEKRNTTLVCVTFFVLLQHIFGFGWAVTSLLGAFKTIVCDT